MWQTSFSPVSLVKKHRWVLVDARNQPLGRLSTSIATLLRGKHDVNFAFHVGGTMRVVVINARHVKLTGHKLTQMIYYRHSGYPGGLKQVSCQEMLRKRPCYLVEHAVRLMTVKNRIGRQQLRHLFVYPDQDHPHHGQEPRLLPELVSS